MAPLGELSDSKAAHLACAEDAEHFALAALDPDRRDEIIAVVRYEREAGGERAEYAAVVEDSWQGRGVRAAMTARLIETARDGGVQCLYALVSPGNERMLGLLRGLGLPTRVGRQSGAECIEVDLLGDGVAEWYTRRGPGVPGPKVQRPCTFRAIFCGRGKPPPARCGKNIASGAPPLLSLSHPSPQRAGTGLQPTRANRSRGDRGNDTRRA